MKRIYNVVTIFFWIILTISISALLYDLSYYDPSYINRNAITFNYNNLNSSKAKKIYKNIENFFYYLVSKISIKHEGSTHVKVIS